jgi:hypothetical protein
MLSSLIRSQLRLYFVVRLFDELINYQLIKKMRRSKFLCAKKEGSPRFYAGGTLFNSGLSVYNRIEPAGLYSLVYFFNSLSISLTAVSNCGSDPFRNSLYGRGTVMSGSSCIFSVTLPSTPMLATIGIPNTRVGSI